MFSKHVLLIFLLMDSTKNLVKSTIIFDIDHNVDVTNGELIVSIPFPLMSTPNINILPKLKLVYRSGQYLKNGILGLGWSLDGLSQISRCSKTIANDGPIDDYTLKFNFDDPFCLDEQRLLVTKGKHGFADSEYVTQNDQFNRIVAFGQNVNYSASQTVEVNSKNHPNYFKMYTKDNLIFTYGNGANSDVKHPNLANVTINWLLNQIEDYNGNKVNFLYSIDAKQTYVTSILYSNKKIVFEYEQRLPTDHVKTYFDKALIQNIEKRLKKIKFYSNNKFAKGFEIDYKSIEPTKQSLLKKVSMCFENNLCSKPIEFNYSSEEPLSNFLSKPIFHENVCGENSFCELIQMIDLNGDGLKDIVGFGQDAIYVSLNEGNFFYNAERWSSAFCQDSGWTSSKHVRYLADINNDNLPDVVGFGDNGVFVSLNDNGKFLTMEKWSSNFGFNSGWRMNHLRLLEDMNNDGYVDIVGIGHSNQMIVDFNNQSSFEKRKIINLPSNWSKVSWNSVFHRLVDIHSNGLKHFFTIPGRDISFLGDHVEVLGSLGSTSFSSINGWSIGNHYREFIDLNNDNLPDMVGIDSSNRIHVGIATPSSQNWKTKYFSTSIESVKKSKTKEENVFNADLNGDGLPDFVFFQCDGIFVSLNMANNFSTEQLWKMDKSFCDFAYKAVQPVDINGDSLPDLIFLNKNRAKIYLNLNKKPRLEAIRDSLGNEKKIYYQSTANKTIYTESKFNFNSTYSSRGFAFDVVSEFSSSDGIGGMSSIEYKYGEYRCSKIQGRSCSFGWIKSQNQNSKIFSTQQFHHKHPLTGMLLSKSSFYANKLITRTNFTYTIKQTELIGDKKSWTILIKSKESEFYDIDGLFLKKEIDLNEYDDFGNVVQSKSSLIDQNSNYTIVVLNEMDNDLTEWYLGKLVSKKVYNIWKFDSKNDLKTTEENYLYNETSRKVSKRVINANMFYSLEEVFEYDQFGNLIKETKKGRKSRKEFEERTTRYDYDNLGINKIKETNPLGHFSYYFYDTNDNLVQLIDVNNVTTNYTYNSVGQKIFESIEGKSNSSSEYFFFNGIKNSVYCISNSVFGGKKITSCYDSLKRQVRKTTNGFNGELILEDTVYNQNGLVEKQSLPYKAFEEQPKYTRFEYDDLMREMSRYEPYFEKDIDEKIEIIYRGNHLITSDSTGFLKIETKNLLGKIVRVEDGERSISFYEYDAFQNLVNIIDPQNVSTNMTFDNNGKKVKNFDPYMGFSEHEYNSFGELIATFNQDGTVIKTERDLLGRVTKLVEPDGTTIKKYDSGLFSIGKLSSLNVLSGYQVDTKFDRYGRQILKNYLYDSNDKYVEEFEYDEFGRLSSIQVQNVNGSKFKTFYCYKNGFLAALSVDDKDCNRFVWKALEYGSNLKIKEEQYGNGIKNKYSFDETDMVTQILSTRNIQLINNLKYDYDVRRNLLKSEEFDPLASKKLTKKFSYDSLDRLVSASHFESTGEKTSLESVQSWSYDNIGNILHHGSSKQQSVYNYDPDKPQLATMVGSEKVLYDNYGRIIKTDSYSVDWYSFSKPRSIRQKNSTIEYLYGGDKENIMKKITDDKKSLRINYIGTSYENWQIGEKNSRKNTEKYYLKVFGRVVAVFINNTDSNSSIYFNSDGFNSINLITDHKGDILVRYNYTAFGYRQISFINSSNDLNNLLNKGFSGKELVDDERLVFFGGRIFDTVLLRFLSPDLFIQQPFNIQNLNRYSYGLNNPFKYDDPSGFFFKKLRKIFSKPKILLAVAAAVVTGFAMAPLAAGIAASAVSITGTTGLAATVVSGAVAGAVTGAGTGLASSLVVTNGNLKESVKGAYKGALSGAVVGSFGSAFNNQYAKFSAETVGQGVDNRLNGRKFFSDFDLNAASFGASIFYEKIVGYELDAAPGGEAVDKGPNGRPVKGANNIGCQTGTCGSFNEGGKYSVKLNQVPSINAIAGLHDVFQISLPDTFYVRDILNVPGMPVAALYTYASFYHQIECPLCDK